MAPTKAKILCNLKFSSSTKVFLKVLAKIPKNNITKNIPVDIDKVNKNKFSFNPKLSKNKSTVITPGQGQSPKTIEKPKIFFTLVSWQCSQLLFLKIE